MRLLRTFRRLPQPYSFYLMISGFIVPAIVALIITMFHMGRPDVFVASYILGIIVYFLIARFIMGIYLSFKAIH